MFHSEHTNCFTVEYMIRSYETNVKILYSPIFRYYEYLLKQALLWIL